MRKLCFVSIDTQKAHDTLENFHKKQFTKETSNKTKHL